MVIQGRKPWTESGLQAIRATFPTVRPGPEFTAAPLWPSAGICGWIVSETDTKQMTDGGRRGQGRHGQGGATFGLCHGVRRGKVQAWFRKKPGNANVIGTDISQTATQFENTVRWDFHDENPDWEAKADFVYSNSWDHAYDPGKAFHAWAKCLKHSGWLLIDHTGGLMPESSNVLVPFGATRDAVIRILGESCGDLGRVTVVLDCTGDEEYPETVIVFQRG